VVTYEEPGNRVSVIYTSFGLARLEKKLMVGTWLRMTIYEDDPEIQLQQRATTADRMGTHYLVRKWEKIKPPMSTRVVEVQNSEERLLVSGGILVSTGDPSLVSASLLQHGRTFSSSGRSLARVGTTAGRTTTWARSTTRRAISSAARTAGQFAWWRCACSGTSAATADSAGESSSSTA
jgi:hypothetical protein